MQAVWAFVSPPRRLGQHNAYKGLSKAVGGGRGFPRGGAEDVAAEKHEDHEKARHSLREGIRCRGCKRRAPDAEEGRKAQGTAASVAGGQEGRVWLQVGVTARVVCAEAVGGGGRGRGRGRK